MNPVQQAKAVAAFGTFSGALWAATFASFSATRAGTWTSTRLLLQVGPARTRMLLPSLGRGHQPGERRGAAPHALPVNSRLLRCMGSQAATLAEIPLRPGLRLSALSSCRRGLGPDYKCPLVRVTATPSRPSCVADAMNLRLGELSSQREPSALPAGAKIVQGPSPRGARDV